MKTIEDFISEDLVPSQDFEGPRSEIEPIVEQSQGFVIKEIDMKGFMRYVQRTEPPITFPGKFTVITGKTGSGKTSILDAITFALYKRTSRTDIQNIKISDVCLSGGFVRVTFFQNGEEYEVERGFTQSGSPYLSVKRNGNPLSGNIKDLEKTVEDVIGLDYDGFRNSTFVRQDEMKDLGAESAAKRLEIFQKLFRLETFERAQALSSMKLEEIKKQIAALETEISIRTQHAERLPRLMEELATRKKEVEREKAKLTQLTTRLDETNKELEKLQKKHDEFSGVRGKRESVTENLKRVNKKLELATEKRRQVGPLKEEIAALEKETGEYEKIRTEGEHLREKQLAHQNLKRELERETAQKTTLESDKKEGLLKLTNRLSAYEKRIAGLSTKMGKEEAFNLLRLEGTLGERIDRIELELDWLSERKDLAKELRAERKKAQSELSRVKNETGNINEDSFVLSEIESSMKQVKADSEVMNSDFEIKIKEAQERIKKCEGDLKALDFSEEERRRISAIRSKVAGMEKIKNELAAKRKQLEEVGDMGTLISDLTNQKTSLTKELEEQNRHLGKLSSEEENFQRTKKTLGSMQKERENLIGAISRWEGEIARFESQIAELNELKKRIEAAKESLKENQEKGEIYSLLRDKVFHKRGIVMYAIDQLLPQLSLETSTNLSDMTDGRFNKVRLNSYQDNNRYGIRIEVSGSDGKWHDVQEFSGGEKTQINAALRFAIAKELASMPQVGRTYGRMKTLFIDEGDLGSLDTESSRQLFVAKLFGMGEFFEKIILITHLSEVAERFPYRIMVYMTPEEESRIKVME